MRLTPLEPWVLQKTGTKPPLSRTAIEAYQLDMLNRTLVQARRSPFYREHLAGCPQHITSVDELTAFPFTTAQDIRQQTLRFVCVSQDEISRVVTLDTSGTTGSPKRVYFTLDDQELTTDFFHIGMSTLAQPGDVVLILLPGATPGSVGDLLANGLSRLGAIPLKHGPVRDAAEVLHIIRQEKVDCLVGVPVQVLQLERLRCRLQQAPLRMKTMLLTTDHVPASIVDTLQQAWQVEVFNHYGMTEMGLGGGVECAAHRGYHLREADLFFEIVDPQSGRSLPEGEYGEVVFTTLTRRGMPLIRYRSGDISRFIPGKCPCGSVLKNLEVVRDRMTGRLALAGGELTMSRLNDLLFALPRLENFSAVVSGSGDYRRLTLQVDMPGMPPQQAKAEVMAALLLLPSIDRMVKDGNLLIEIEPGEMTRGSMAKRSMRSDGV